MRYIETPPLPCLRAFVHCIWILETSGCSEDASTQRILPDGRPEFVIHFGDVCRKIDPLTDKAELQSRSLMIGASKSSVLLVPGKNAKMIGVRFKPSGAMRFLKTAMKDFTDQIVSLHDWSPKCSAEIEERILKAETDQERITIIQNFLMKQLMDGRPDLVLSKMISEIVRSNGSLDFRKTYSDFNISERQAERKFLAGIGIGPKLFARIVRFQNIVKMINQAPRRDLTELAVDFGYYDQSHFIREFKSFAGISPRAYISETHPVSDYFTAS